MEVCSIGQSHYEGEIEAIRKCFLKKSWIFPMSSNEDIVGPADNLWEIRTAECFPDICSSLVKHCVSVVHLKSLKIGFHMQKKSHSRFLHLQYPSQADLSCLHMMITQWVTGRFSAQ